jgi:hypothetical protein
MKKSDIFVFANKLGNFKKKKTNSSTPRNDMKFSRSMSDILFGISKPKPNAICDFPLNQINLKPSP